MLATCLLRRCVRLARDGAARRATALLAAAAVLAATPAPAAREHKPQPAIDPVALARLVHARVNAERKAQRLAALDFDDALAVVAAGHSRDMAAKGYFSHSAPDGSGFPERYKRGGYPCALRVGNVIHGGAENLARGNLVASVTTINGEAFYDWNSAEALARQTVAGWMKSPGHRKNMLTAHWLREGIGIAVAADGKVYVTQNFC